MPTLFVAVAHSREHFRHRAFWHGLRQNVRLHIVSALLANSRPFVVNDLLTPKEHCVNVLHFTKATTRSYRNTRRRVHDDVRCELDVPVFC